MATAQTSTQQEMIYPGFKFDVYKIAPDLYIVKDQVTQQVREVEHTSQNAILSARDLDRRAGYEDELEV